MAAAFSRFIGRGFEPAGMAVSILTAGWPVHRQKVDDRVSLQIATGPTIFKKRTDRICFFIIPGP